MVQPGKLRPPVTRTFGTMIIITSTLMVMVMVTRTGIITHMSMPMKNRQRMSTADPIIFTECRRWTRSTSG